VAWRHGAVDIASASETEDPGLNTARVHIRFFGENIAMLLCFIDLKCIVCELKKINKGIGQKNEKRNGLGLPS
jgi:hypothetical protein